MPAASRTRSKTLIVLGVTLALVALSATIVLANHQFPDVPTSAYYHGSVSFLVDHGITAGCGGGKYCPNDPVTRGQMAVFLEKTHNIAPIVKVAHLAGNNTYTTATNVLSVTLTIPSPNSARLVMRFSAESSCYGGTGSSWCGATFLVDGTDAFAEDFAYDSSDGATEVQSSWESHSFDRSVVVGPGTHTIAARVMANSNGSPTLWIGQPELVVEAFIV